MKFGMFMPAAVSTFALTVFQAGLAVAAPLLEEANETLTTNTPYFGNAGNTTTTTSAPDMPLIEEGALIGVGVVVGVCIIVTLLTCYAGRKEQEERRLLDNKGNMEMAKYS